MSDIEDIANDYMLNRDIGDADQENAFSTRDEALRDRNAAFRDLGSNIVGAVTALVGRVPSGSLTATADDFLIKIFDRNYESNIRLARLDGENYSGIAIDAGNQTINIELIPTLDTDSNVIWKRYDGPGMAPGASFGTSVDLTKALLKGTYQNAFCKANIKN
ncbi:MAG: hypothetical protein SGJ27_27060 [Candidatus Melainabacteria bacterium]|nr:hypothetical protein [Candidatus Melainabacteria bacterium]